MEQLSAVNLAVRFAVELCALAAFAYWGAQVSSSTIVNVVVAIAVPVAGAVAWGLFVSPRAPWRLRGSSYLVAQVVFFALAAAGQETFAWIFGAVAAVNTAFVYILPANAFQEH